jgi:hypothetical protein
MRTTSAVLLILVACATASAQTLKDCRTIMVQPMPESLDRFISAELVKWGQMKVVVSEDKAECLASFGRQASTAGVSSTGSAVVPEKTDVRVENGAQRLPQRYPGYGYRSAALDVVHKDSAVVVWAGAKGEGAYSSGGPQKLAEKLVAQLKKDFQKAK